jgi:hypothetical protein
MKKEADGSIVTSLYIDESGKVFSAKDIISGYKPKGKYKGYSIENLLKLKND